MTRMLGALITAILVLCGPASSVQAAVSVPAGGAAIYTYDAPIYDAPGDDSVQERGPPMAPRPEVLSTRLTTTYVYPAALLQVARPTTTTGSQVRAEHGDLLSLRRSGVAANSERLLAKADRIEQHLTRLDHSPANDAMLARIRGAAADGTPLSKADRAFIRHDSTEAWLMDRGVNYGPAHRVAGWTHRTYGNYDPSVIKQFPDMFNRNWRNHWGIE